ncbi:MAG: hypothetical protein Q8Q39_05730 [bacterium]|nr:hypothetical protein [bacterium]
MKIRLRYVTYAALALLPSLAAAQEVYDLTEHNPLPSLSFSRLLCTAANVVVSLGLVVVVVMIGIAGIMILTSRGNEQKRTGGKKALETAIVGFLILLLAKSIILVILGFLGVPLTSMTC